MAGEEYSGPPGPKLTRLVYFVGAGVFCTFAINKYREYERNTIIRQQQQQEQQNGSVKVVETPKSTDAVVVRKPLKEVEEEALLGATLLER